MTGSGQTKVFLTNVADNLACDEALLLVAEERGGPPALRFWELDHPAVVLGASCRIGENVRVETCKDDGVPIARRSSGGGTDREKGSGTVSHVISPPTPPASKKRYLTPFLSPRCWATCWDCRSPVVLDAGDPAGGVVGHGGGVERRSAADEELLLGHLAVVGIIAVLGDVPQGVDSLRQVVGQFAPRNGT